MDHRPGKSRTRSARRLGAITAALAVSGLLTFAGQAAVSAATPAARTAAAHPAAAVTTATRHFAPNVGRAVSAAAAAGFNVIDVAASTTNPAGTKATVDALPSGLQALVWVGNLDNSGTSTCPAPGFSVAAFQAVVNTLAGDAKVFGYYVSDEPHPKVCPTAAADIKARADYIRAHDPTHKSFIVVQDGSNQCGTNLGCEYAALQPAKTDVDLIGLDPYPCHYSGTTAVPCDNSKITKVYNLAVSKGISPAAVVPVFQTFGQEGRTDGRQVYYRTPTATELGGMLATWAGLAPHPVMDYAYTFGVQCSAASCPAPQALANHPELLAVIQQHNA